MGLEDKLLRTQDMDMMYLWMVTMSRATEFVEKASNRGNRWHKRKFLGGWCNYKFSGDEDDDAFVHWIRKLEKHAEIDQTREVGTLWNSY